MKRAPMAHPMAEIRRRERRSLVIQTAAFIWLVVLVVIAFPLLAP